MIPPYAKEWFVALSNFIDNKLKTPTGRLTLLIVNCLILGGAVVHSCNVTTNLQTITVKELKASKRADSLQTEINNYIQTSDERCNKKLEEGALFQRKMQEIYSQKEEENYMTIEENRRIIEERKKLSKDKMENIKALTNLKKTIKND